MTRHRGIGKTGLIIAAILMVAMCSISYFYNPDTRLSGNLGICLPSPNHWNIDPLWSYIINCILLGAIAAGGFLLNRKHNFIRSTQPVLPALFMVLAASVPWTDCYLSSSTIICAINLLSISILFNCYDSKNATQEMFAIGTFFSVGSMIQYAFIPYIGAYIVAAIVMKAFRIKELLATIMGIVAPYWVGIGLGLIPLENFKLPQITNLFSGFTESSDLFVLMLSVGIAIFFGLILGLNNSIKLYAGNSRINALNMTISLIGIVSMICIIVDFANMMAYLSTLYFTVAVQVANLCALWTIKREWLVVTIPAFIYLVFFVLLLLG